MLSKSQVLQANSCLYKHFVFLYNYAQGHPLHLYGDIMNFLQDKYDISARFISYYYAE